jgi:hypothetical protein
MFISIRLCASIGVASVVAAVPTAADVRNCLRFIFLSSCWAKSQLIGFA